MPRYFFHTYNGLGFIRDEEGQEHADDIAAREQAIRGIRSIISEEVLRGKIDLAGKLDVADAEGKVLFSIPFEEAVELRLGETKFA